MTSSANTASSRRRALAIGAYFVAVAGLLGASLWLVDDLWTHSERTAELQSRFDLLAARSTAAKAEDGDHKDPFFSARTDSLAAAALEQRVSESVSKGGGALTSSQVELGEEGQGDSVRLIASFEVDQPALQAILYDLEAGMPYLFIDKLTIQSPTDFGEPESGRLRVTMDVLGQWRQSN